MSTSTTNTANDFITSMEMAWARLHLDYASPVKGKMYLIIVDTHYKQIKAVCTPSAISFAVIEELRVDFAQFGLHTTFTYNCYQ